VSSAPSNPRGRRPMPRDRHGRRDRALRAIACGLGLLLAPVLLARAQVRDDSPHGRLAIDCGECHSPEGWAPLARSPRFQHDGVGFALEATHRSASCRACHGSLVFNHVGTACADCHQDAHRGELGVACDACHRPTTWTNQAEIFRVHNRSRFPLLAVHARLDCAACHGGQRVFQYATTPAECGNCHLQTYLGTTSPQHLTAGFSRRCEDCHSVTSTTWMGAHFDHVARFPLRGGHARVACDSCHAGGIYQGLPSRCESCHQADYARTTNPAHVAGGFPTSCDDCHTIDAWRPAQFDHDLSHFPLTGAHTRVDCAQCHVGGRFTGTATACAACHQPDYDRTTNPDHRASGFPTRCDSCHDTAAWRPAQFNHDRTRFPLEGAHRRVSCEQCHSGGRFKGTPTRCFACHEADYNRTTSPNHQAAGFPPRCEACHDTKGWRPADFDHDSSYFPIFSGRHRGVWSGCADCHVNPANFRRFECVLCHRHSDKPSVDAAHSTVGGYVYQSSACYRCHPRP